MSKIAQGLFSGWLLAAWCCTAVAIGPPPSDEVDEETGTEREYPSVNTTTRLNVVVPLFDPNIPDDPDDYEKEGVWPELRRAESSLFAIRLRDELEATGLFGAVRVTPNSEAIGELYVLGKILESTSEEVELEITVIDISERNWINSKKFKYRVREYDFNSPRNAGKDHYQPVYEEIAEAIARELARKKEKDLLQLQDISSLVFARSYSNETFGQYFKRRSRTSKRPVSLVGLPADDDPKFLRIEALRAREELFVDELQNHYRTFIGETGTSYSVWQKASFPEAKEYRLAREKANKQLFGAILAGAGAAVLANQSDGTSGTNDKIMEGAAIATGAGAVVLAYNSFKTRKESKIYFEQLSEAGQAVDVDLVPKNVEFEGKTVEITGNAERQFQKFRAWLKQVYEDEATPQTQL